MRVSIAVFEAPEKTVELVPRMFQLHKQSPPELRGNSWRMQSILRARTWDARIGLYADMSGQDYALRPGTLLGGGRPEFLSQAPGLRKAIKLETRSVSFL